MSTKANDNANRVGQKMSVQAESVGKRMKITSTCTFHIWSKSCFQRLVESHAQDGQSRYFQNSYCTWYIARSILSSFLYYVLLVKGR